MLKQSENSNQPIAIRSEDTLFVDLDGSLISSDLLWEALPILVRQRPWALFMLPIWLFRGRACLKAEISARVQIGHSRLPYREEILNYIDRARSEGRHVVLASASPRSWVEAVANHLGRFDAVLASDDQINLKSENKLTAIQDYLQAHGDPPTRFEYLGDDRADLPVWRAAGRATLAGGSKSVRSGLVNAQIDFREVAPIQPIEHRLRSIFRVMRPYQWAKNALLLLPLLLAHQIADIGQLSRVLVAVATFCLVASGTYILNDLMDLDADRRHPRKRSRPFASGQLPLSVGFWLGPLLMATAVSISVLALSELSTLMLLGYAAMTLAYTMVFKEKLLLDVMLLAALYTHRVLAGGVAASVEVSPWLLAFSTFFFLSLALVKRFVELQDTASENRGEVSRRAYRVGDLGLVESMGIASGYISVLVLCLFVSSNDVSRLYVRPQILWLMCPVMLYWITRVWMLARRGELHDDPVLFAIKDRVSYVAGLLVVATVVAAAI